MAEFIESLAEWYIERVTKMKPDKAGPVGELDPSDKTAATRRSDRDAMGKFVKGNPGMPRGSRHKTTIMLERLLDGEAEALHRAIVAAAKAGDPTAMRLLYERLNPPRARPVSG